MIEWDDRILTGDETIDKQHRAFHNALVTLHNATTENHGRLAIGKVVHYIEGYIVEHFFLEERLAEKYDYPASRMTAHRADHAAFKAEIQSKVEAYKKAGYDHRVLLELSNRLAKWFVEHVERLDVDLARWIKEKNRTNSAG